MDQNPNTDEFSNPADPNQASQGPPSNNEEAPYTHFQSHPIFQCNDNGILSSISETLNILFQPDPDMMLFSDMCQQLSFQLFQVIFSDKEPQDLYDEFQELGLSNSAACGKLIGLNDIYFRCLDCEIYGNPSFICLQCQECFEKANHDGHRIVMMKPTEDGSATCDCGDTGVFSKDGSCPQHEYKEVSLEEAVKNFPADMKENFVDTMKKAFYGIISLFELLQKTTNYGLRRALNYFAQVFSDQVHNFCIMCTSEISNSFLPLLEMVFQTQFEAPYNKVWHNCNDFTGDTQRKENINVSHACTCTIVGSLCRIGLCLEESQQSKLHQILAECCKEARFRDFLSVEMSKSVHYLYGSPYLNIGFQFQASSKLLGLHPQIYSRESLLNRVIDSGHFQNFIRVMSRAINDFPEMSPELYETMLSVTYGINHFLDPLFKSIDKLLNETNFFNDLLEGLLQLQNKFIYTGEIKLGLFEHDVNSTLITTSIATEKCIRDGLERSLKRISKYPIEEKRAFIKAITTKWYKCFTQTFEVSKKRQENKEISFIYGLERVFCLIIKCYLDSSITKEGVRGFFKEFLPEIDPSSLVKQVITGPLRTMGMVRFIDVIRHVKSIQQFGYYHIKTVNFETDFVLTQMMSLLIKPQELFGVIAENFFSYNEELKSFYQSPKSFELIVNEPYFKQTKLILEDFLGYLIYLMNDELCDTNLNLAQVSGKEDSSDCVSEKIVQKVLVNILLGQYWTDISNVKEILKNLLLDTNLIDTVIHKITVQDEKTHKIRIKDQYEAEFDPYIFYRMQPIQQEINNNIASKKSNRKQIDLVSGRFYNDLPDYLKDIQRNIFKSQLPEFLRFLLTHFCKEVSHLLRPTLKLVLLNLQILEDNLKTKSHGIEILHTKVQENYLNPEFSESLNNILNQEGFREFEPCIEKIQSIIRKLASQSDADSPLLNTSPLQKSPGITDSEKKKQARDMMEKMKEEFAKKQALFADKNQALLENKKLNFEEHKDEKQETSPKEDIACQYCLEKIEETNVEYGVPIYIAFTNNFYNTQEKIVFERQDNSDLSKANWWPVISSCHHFYHKKCFDKHFKNSKGPSERARSFFKDRLETYCSLCKAVCNNFLCLNKETSIIKEDAPEESNEQPPQLSLTFTQKVGEVFEGLQERLMLFSPKKLTGENGHNNSVPVAEIFKRAYHYLLESLYLSEKSSDLQRMMRLYGNFFRVFIKESENVNTNPEHKLDFLEKLSEELSPQASNKEKVFSLSSKVLSDDLFSILLSRSPNKSSLSQENLVLIKDFIKISLLRLIRSKMDKITSIQTQHSSLFSLSQEVVNQIFIENSLFIQKIILSSYINSYVLDGKEDVITETYQLLNSLNHDVAILDLVFEQTEIPYSFAKLVQESYDELKTKSESELNKFESIINSLGEQTVDFSTARFAPRIIRLPKTYHEFNNTFFRKKCYQCHQYSKKLLTSLCLICGEVICTSSCSSINVPGNLNRHASQYHMGLGLFLEMHNMDKLIVDCPLNVITGIKDIYADELGQAIQTFVPQNVPRSLDFSKFVLQEDSTRYLEGMIKSQSMGKEIFEKAMNTNGTFISPGLL